MAFRSESARRWSVWGGSPRICSSPCRSRGVRRAGLDQGPGREGSSPARGPRPGRPPPPLGQLTRHGPRRIRETPPNGVGARRPALRCARRLTAHGTGTPQRPVESAAFRQALLEHGTQLEQQARVVGGVLELLLGEYGRLSQRVKPSLPCSLTLRTLRTSRSPEALLIAVPQESRPPPGCRRRS